MPSDDSEQSDKQEIPPEKQDLSTEEIVEQDYEVLSSSEHDGEQRSEDDKRIEYRGGFLPPGRTHLDDSIEASSEDPGGTPDGKEFTAGYESQMATRIGDEDTDDDVDRLRELHEGRHQSDGEHSVRESQRDKKRVAQGICSSLPLARHERRDVVTIVEQLDLTQFGSQRSIPKAVLGAAIVVVDEHHRQSREEVEDFLTWSEEFRTVCAEHNVSMSDLSTVKKKIREALGSGGAILGPDRPRRDPALPGPTSMGDLPDEYWENLPAESWVGIAKGWEYTPEEVKESIPSEYKDRVKLLRRWKPWPDDDVQGEKNTVSTSAPSEEFDEEELAEEAEALVEEMDADDEENSN